MAGFLSTLFQKLPEGSPSLIDAYRIIMEDKGKQVRANTPQGYALQTPLKTQYGTAVTSGEIGDMFKRAQEERANSLAQQYTAPETLGVQTQKYVAPGNTFIDPEPTQSVINSSNSIIPIYSEEQKQKAINLFAQNASKINPNSQYRKTVDDAKKNSEYVKQYLEEVFRQAPQYNLDPMMITAIAGQESGWGGTRYGNNLLGSGIFDNGTNLGRGQTGEGVAADVGSLLKSISEDWGGIYQNKTTPEQFVEGKYKWNVHPEWVQNVGMIRNSLN